MQFIVRVALLAGLLACAGMVEAWGKQPHGPTTIVTSHPDGTHTVAQVGKQDPPSDPEGYYYRELKIMTTEQQPTR